MLNDIPEEGRLTTEEVRQNVEGGEKLTDEQIEAFNDFVALAAVITYDALKKEALGKKTEGSKSFF